jgi:putative two-component system response regulator
VASTTKDKLETLYSPDAIQSGTTPPGVPKPGPTWDVRLRGLVIALETRAPGAAGHGRRVAERSRTIGGRYHERLDGSGYPDRLRGGEIPLGARIIAVADTFDALTSCRPYRDANPPGAAIGIILEESGATLDARVVAAFVA